MDANAEHARAGKTLLRVIILLLLVQLWWLHSNSPSSDNHTPSLLARPWKAVFSSVRGPSDPDSIHLHGIHTRLRSRTMGSTEKGSHFKKIQQFTPDYVSSTITQYESQQTGMQVVVVDAKGPMVYGFFSIASEIHDDSGAPHTLEHLCFSGSKRYPYKGLLNKLAQRSYSETNAWTGIDESGFYLESAGWDGFAQELPVFLDHILFPTLTDAAFITEVHHIDGEGRDAGVVYAEMQGRENTKADIVQLAMQRLLYPEGDGLRSQTWGLMEALRVLTPEQVREFHRKRYTPKNLRLILIGEVDHTDMLNVLDKFERGIKDAVPKYHEPFKRPWVESKRTPPLEKTVVHTVEFPVPEDDESSGEIHIAFFGPESTDRQAMIAFNILFKYLADPRTSVLRDTFVENERLVKRLFGSAQEKYNLILTFQLEGVIPAELQAVQKRFFKVLNETASTPLDMGFLTDCLRRSKKEIETGAGISSVSFKQPIIQDHLYGNRNGAQLHKSLATLDVFDELRRWTEQDWRGFLQTWFIDNPHVSLLAKPSATLYKKQQDEENARIKRQRELLGEKGLQACAKKLKDAQEENSKPIPDRVLQSFGIPSTKSIHFFEIDTARSGLAKRLGTPDSKIQKIMDENIDENKSESPLFVQYALIPNPNVRFDLVLGTADVPTELKPLLSLYMHNFFSTPITKNGKRIEHMEVASSLIETIIGRTCQSAGQTFRNDEMVHIMFVAEPRKLKDAVEWLASLLVDPIFDAERLVFQAHRILEMNPHSKRDGESMANAVSNMIHLQPASASYAMDTLVEAVFYKRLIMLLQSDPQKVLDMMEALRKNLITLSNIRVFASGNFEQLQNPGSILKHLADVIQPNSEPTMRPIDDQKAVLSEAGRQPGGHAYIVPLSIDSSFVVLTSKGPGSYTSSQRAPLKVAIEYLNAADGPIWAAVRGKGLAYGASFGIDLDRGLLEFGIRSSPKPFTAFEEVREVMADYASGRKKIDQLGLEGTVASIVRGSAYSQRMLSIAVMNVFTDQVMLGLNEDLKDSYLAQVGEVTADDVRKIIEDVVMKVFEPGKANLVITCSDNMVEGVKEKFDEVGFKPVIKALGDFQDAYGLEVEEGDEESGSEPQ